MNLLSGSNLPWSIAPLNPQEAPWHLLLAADPSRDNVQRYLRSCAGFAARETTPDSPHGRGAILGICLLMALPAASAFRRANPAFKLDSDPPIPMDTPVSEDCWPEQTTTPASSHGSLPAQWEVMNLAVAPTWQHQGVGSVLLQQAIAFARAQGAKQLLVGTGSFGDQLLFYQRSGFRVTGIERDFFLQHYTTQLWERGAQHKDMLRLSLDL